MYAEPAPAEMYHKVAPRQGQRTVRVHVTETARNNAIEAQQFCTNKIVTARYDSFSFIPISLFQQFQRPANLYFLLISALQCRPELSTTGWGTTLLPLLFVLLLNGLKEGFDDWKRKSSDRKVNYRQVEILKDDYFQCDDWSTVVVGDILKVNTDEEFPADLVFLSSSDPQGLAYVETANLDGESSLKLRHSFYKLARLTFQGGDMSLSVFSGMVIRCERPNNRLFQFEGSISLQGEGKLEVDETQILLRGATLRNTEWVLGAVVFTGMDTKLMRNMIAASRKVSSLEKNSNILVAILLAFLFGLCLALAIAADAWVGTHKGHYYIPAANKWPEPKPGINLVFVQLLRFLLLLNEFVPLSMYVTLELVKVMQCLFVNWDIHMFYRGTNTPARARASGLTEELGQVEYILSDKTGTLTQNLMAFIKCSIGGEMYGKSSAESSSLNDTEEKDYDDSRSVHNVRYDPILMDILTDASTAKAQLCRAFFTHVALCHTVIPRYLFDDEAEEVRYQSTSPDEAALVQGAAECGFQLKQRTAEEIVVFIEGQGLEHFRILAVLEFTPERKRMSIICQEHKGRIKLYCKGADTVIFKRLANSQSTVAEASLQHLEEFAKCGYRTLCMAERELSQVEFESWSMHFRQASLALDDRDEKLAASADIIERDMVLLGVSAVEDKLQEGVPETVTLLAAAGIKVWVLTGDKLETAVSIGLSCNLLAESMHLFLLSESVAGSVPQLLRTMVEEARAYYKAALTSESSSMATVIEGASVGVALEESNRLVFLELCQYCRAVVCCRVSPIQKAQVTRLVKDDGGAVTLAIGDGANDVGMIKAAQIGVGISGREGRAAVMASDYALGQFRFLSRLLLVHGRWSYKRNRDMIMYSIYKNIVISMSNFFLSFFSAFSAQSFYPQFFTISYNFLWTSLPTLLCAILDKDVSARTSENNPQIYGETQLEKSHQFIWNMNGWFLSGLWHSAVAFTFPCLAVLSASKNGETGGIWTLGLAVYTVSIFIVTMKLALHTKSYTLYHVFSLLLSVVVWLALIYFLSLSYQLSPIWASIKAEGENLYASQSFWFLLALSPIAACLPDAAFGIFSQQRSPTDAQIMREMEHGYRNGVYVKHHPGFVERVSDFSSGQGGGEEDGSVAAELEESASQPTDPESPQEGSGTEADGTTSPEPGFKPRRMTWREVVNDDEIDGIDQINMLSRYGRRSSSGFQIVKSHTDTPATATIPIAPPGGAKESKGLEAGAAPKPSALPSEIEEALGIEKTKGTVSLSSSMSNKGKEGASKAGGAASPWTNFRKRWSVTPAPQREAPVEITSRNAPKATPKVMTKKPRKKKAKANTAMSRLTRLASSKISMIADSGTFADVDELVRSSPSDQMVRDDRPPSPLDYPSSLPYVPDDQRQYWNSEEPVSPKSKGSPRFQKFKQTPAYDSSSEISRSSEFFEATGWSEPDRPIVFQPRGDNRNSSNYLGYSPSKPVMPSFMPPPPPLRPPPGDIVNPARNRSTFEHYSRLTGGPSYHDYQMEHKREPGPSSPGRNRGDRKRETRAPGQYARAPASYGRDYAKAQKDMDRDYGRGNDYGQPSPEAPYFRSRESSTYDPPVLGYPKTEFKGKRKSPVFHAQHAPQEAGRPSDIESGGDMADERSSLSFYGQTKSAAASTSGGDADPQKEQQPRYRRSSSGHVSYTVPDTSDAPSHDSPFADYTKHGVREGPRQGTQEGSEDARYRNDEASASKDAQAMKPGKPPKSPMLSIDTGERPKGGPPPGPRSKFVRSSSGHISYNVPNVSEAVPHDSPFADYTKHGLRERPRRTSTEDGAGGFSEASSSDPSGRFLDSESAALPDPTSGGFVPPSKFIITGRSPWASETGDPSHSVFLAPAISEPLQSLGNNSAPLVVAESSGTQPGPALTIPASSASYPATTPEITEMQAASPSGPEKVLRQSKMIDYD